MACARLLTARTLAVGIADIDQARVDAAVMSISAELSPGVAGVVTDIADRSSLALAWAHIEEQVGPIDAVINCAGTFVAQALEDITDADWEFALRTNLTGPFVVCQHAAGLWRRRGTAGSIVNVSSTAATNSGFFEATSYGAAKAGLIGMSTHLANKLGPSGIRVNSVAPGSFRSPMNASRLNDPEEVARSSAGIPLGRVGETEEVASAAVYLALDASYVTGVTLRVDGGLLTRM